MQMPQELFDAARVDGAGHVRSFLQIALPLAGTRLGDARHYHLQCDLEQLLPTINFPQLMGQDDASAGYRTADRIYGIGQSGGCDGGCDDGDFARLDCIYHCSTLDY